MPFQKYNDGMNYRRILKSSTLTRIMVPVNASVLTNTKDVFLLPYIQKTMQRNYGSYKKSYGSIQKTYTTQKKKKLYK